MRAFTKTKYGGPEVLTLEEVPKPVVSEDSVLVKVKANSANPADWHILRGTPWFARLTFGLLRPKDRILGADFSGIVEEVGEKVGQFQIGDRIFGETLMGGAFAEYLVAKEQVCGKMPPGARFDEMACVPIAGLTALQALTSQGKLKKGESVLINGASGGVGHYAVQLAKVFGAIVTAVCSTRNLDFVRSLGADLVIAYDREDIRQHQGDYDLVVDIHGNLSHRDFTRMGKRGVLVGFTTMGHMMTVMLKGAFSKFPLTQFTARANTNDLETLATLIQDNKIKVYIEKRYSFREIPKAISDMEKMRTRGKVAMIWEEDGL
ncbi:MAG: NAD(P)-dependent alcohol dehydrogenase [Saprospiraceae bacterium]|nr:NAD(P)-dependent alcohol dehydrogenase [Saprospiraceae bacterium]